MTTIEAIAIAERNNIDDTEKELLARAIYGVEQVPQVRTCPPESEIRFEKSIGLCFWWKRFA